MFLGSVISWIKGIPYRQLVFIHTTQFYLHERGTNVCGTIKKNMVSKDIRNTPCPKGEQRPFQRNELFCVKFHDKNKMFSLTTMHEATTTAVRKRGRHNVEVQKPDCVLSYNRNIGGVDHID